MYKFFIFTLFFKFLFLYVSNSAFAYGNSTKSFTKNEDMKPSYFLDSEEMELPWKNALIRIPLLNQAPYKGSIKNLKGDESFLKSKYKTILYLHGCSGMWSGELARLDFFAKSGFAVIAPLSLARTKYPMSCDPPSYKAGLYRDTLKLRQIDAKHAMLKIKSLDWVDHNNIFLVGFSEGGIAAATYNPESIEFSFKGRIIEGWTCAKNTDWEEYRGVNNPYDEPILSLVAEKDPWFLAEYLQGHCGEFLNRNIKSKSIVVNDPLLAHQHGLLHHSNIQKTVLEFLKSVID